MRKHNLITILLLAFLLLGTHISRAQEKTEREETKESPLSINLDLMSRYVWRGYDFGASPSIQPAMSYSKWGFTLGTWGAYTLNNINTGIQEVDLYLGYSFLDMFTVTVTDYYFVDEGSDYNYFDYDEYTTGHVFEGSIAFSGTDKLPLSVLLATNFYGNDARRINADGTEGNIQFSTYAEFAYAFKYFDIFMGFNLTTADAEKGESGFYGDSFGVINLGISASKEIKITEKFSLPLYAALITNPQKEKIYLVAGFTF